MLDGETSNVSFTAWIPKEEKKGTLELMDYRPINLIVSLRKISRKS